MDRSTIYIRTARLDDSAEINRLASLLGYDFPQEETREILKQHLSDDRSKIFVACSDQSNRLLGFIHLDTYKTLFSEPLLNILGLAVSADAQSSGIGSALLRKSEEYGKSNNFAGIRANSGIHRETAHKFYLKNDYCEKHSQKRFFKYF